MPDPMESKSVKIGLNITPTESAALDFIAKMHPDRYDGAASVLRDYSLANAVEAHANALKQVAGAFA